MVAPQAAENHGNEWSLTWYLRWDMYTSIPTWTNSQFIRSNRSTEFKDIPPWNISQMITKTLSISMRIVVIYAMKRDIPFQVWQKVNGNWGNNMIRISQLKESNSRTNIAPEDRNKIQKSCIVRVTVRDPSRKVNHLSKVIWDGKFITEFTRSISSTRIG